VYTKVFEIRVDASPEKVWEFHSSARALLKLTPPKMRLRLLGKDLDVFEGAIHEMRFMLFGFIPCAWRTKIDQVTPPYGFTDQAERSPFAYWRHRHDFIPDGEGTLIRDIVVYEMPFGKLGKAVHKLRLSKDIERVSAYRHHVTKQALESSRR